MKKTLSAAIVAAALTLTAACGGSDGGSRPSADEISKALSDKDSVLGTAVPKKAADCMAKVFEESKLSDKTLKALISGDKKYKNEDDTKVLSTMSTDLGKCATAS